MNPSEALVALQATALHISEELKAYYGAVGPPADALEWPEEIETHRRHWDLADGWMQDAIKVLEAAVGPAPRKRRPRKHVQMEAVRTMLAEGVKLKEIARRLGVNRRTLYRRLH
jgi:hypothetical protein